MLKQTQDQYSQNMR